jgi:hypothetical protein
VCGLEDSKRKKRLIVILNGFVDERGDDAVFVMVGYVAPAEEWARFSDEWAAVLRLHPAVAILKTKEAMKLRGEFYRVTEADRDKKLCGLYDVIDRHVSFEVSAVIPMEPFNRIFGNGVLPSAAANPYYHALSGLVSGLARHQIQIGMTEKIDFVFDERVMEQSKLLSIWGRLVAEAPDDVKPMLGRTPVFKSDSDVLPLQAADLETWWLHRRWRERLLGEARIEYPWQPADIPGVSWILTEEEMKKSYDKTLRAHLALGWRPSESARSGPE